MQGARISPVYLILVSTHVLEETKHFVVCRVIGQEETEVRVTQDGCDSDETSTTTGNNSNVLPGVLAVLALTMHLIVELGNSFSQGLDTGGGTVLSAGHGDVDGGRAGEAAFNLIFNLGSTLAKVGPLLGLLEEAILGGTLSAPNDTGRGTAGIETSVGLVAFVGVTELTMSLGLEFFSRKLVT